MKKLIWKIKRFFGCGQSDLELNLLNSFEEWQAYDIDRIRENFEVVFKNSGQMDHDYIELKLLNLFDDKMITFFLREQIHEKIKKFFDNYENQF